jgi:hypothetical protein
MERKKTLIFHHPHFLLSVDNSLRCVLYDNDINRYHLLLSTNDSCSMLSPDLSQQAAQNKLRHRPPLDPVQFRSFDTENLDERINWEIPLILSWSYSITRFKPALVYGK